MRLSVAALCVALLIPAAVANSAPPAPAIHAAHLRGGLTPEERFLYKRQMHGPEWRKLSVAQRCERAKKLRQERRSMNAAQLQNLKQRLDAEWNRLPAAEKRRIEQRIARQQARKAEGKPRTRAHGRRCADIDPAD